jgi:enoyl-CoA hydratase/carnithine racemase
MSRFEEYQDRYRSVKFARDGGPRAAGVLTMTFHTDGGPLRWGAIPHAEFPHAFQDVADDSFNHVVILTGSGEEFSGERGFTMGDPTQLPYRRPTDQGRIGAAGHLLDNLLRIQVPVIGVVNGPAWRHAELPLLSDIVLAADDAVFQDSAHFVNGLPPGDGQHVILPMAMGINRARYYLLTGQVLTAHDAERFGLVNEVLPRAQLMPRARELAALLMQQSPVVLRNTRLILIEQIKRRMMEFLAHGNGLQGSAIPYDPATIPSSAPARTASPAD